MKESKSVKSNAWQHQHENGHFPLFKFAKLLDPEASWDKDQLGDVLHWIRQVVALFYGLLWGAIPVVGGIWIFITVTTQAKDNYTGFSGHNTGIIYGYYAMTLKIDEEEFGGHAALLQEGLIASITLFLLAWILVYSLAHF
ncbi:Rab5-interacting [Gossypium australe]|uniref:Rab5-interacting n=1 Tax=Gossypium australe TaxID=47621 RepID=A0A5B6UL68_9ROSI|nr:Rab5-interacting [Gossypium australe]